MSHPHTAIRTAAVAALTGLASTAARVYANRLWPIAKDSTPALRVSLDSEQVEPLDLHGITRQHRVDLIVECVATGATLDTAADQMQLEVETALAAGLAVGGKTLQVDLIASEYDDEAAATPGAVKRLTFSLTYFTAKSAPDTLI